MPIPHHTGIVSVRFRTYQVSKSKPEDYRAGDGGGKGGKERVLVR